MTTDVLDCNLKEIVGEVFQKQNDSLETVTTSELSEEWIETGKQRVREIREKATPTIMTEHDKV